MVDSTHTGPVQVRFGKQHVMVLCPAGHLVTSGRTGPGGDFAGSWLQARIGVHQHGSQPWVVTCEGALS